MINIFEKIVELLLKNPNYNTFGGDTRKEAEGIVEYIKNGK